MANSTGLIGFGTARRLLVALAALWLWPAGGAATKAAAQPIAFGAADDPREQIQRVWWRREGTFYAMGGLSLIAAQWRGAGSLAVDLVTRSMTARLSGTLRAGYYGEYGPDLDEPYDLLRLVEFARYNPPRAHRVHLRAGLIDRMRLGVGHVVSFFNSAIAWDERTIGAEAIWQGEVAEVAGFTDNVLFDGVAGGRAALRPLSWTRPRHLRTLQVGFNYVTDLAARLPETSRLEAYNVDLQFDLFKSGDIAFSPFASYARYPAFGDGLGFGADLHSEQFIDLFSFRLRLGLFYNSAGFIPGYVGAFYTVNNAQARILNADAEGSEAGQEDLAGVALQDGLGANDLLTEVRLSVFQHFELWYSFRRHYGSQRLSELHLRLFLRSPDQLRIEVGIDRGGLTGFFSIFSKVDDLSALVFGTEYRLAGPFWLFLRARYSYERIDDGDDHAQRYLVQRRFEPMTGLKLTF